MWNYSEKDVHCMYKYLQFSLQCRTLDVTVNHCKSVLYLFHSTWRKSVKSTLNIFAVYLISLTTCTMKVSELKWMNFRYYHQRPKLHVFCYTLENNKRQHGPLGDRQNFEKLRWEKNRKNFWSRQVLVVLITMKN